MRPAWSAGSTITSCGRDLAALAWALRSLRPGAAAAARPAATGAPAAGLGVRSSAHTARTTRKKNRYSSASRHSLRTKSSWSDTAP